jgi:hypothetical protein
MDGMLLLDNFRGENRLKRGTLSSSKDDNLHLCETSKGLITEGDEKVLKGGEGEEMRSSSDFYEDEAQAPLALLGND